MSPGGEHILQLRGLGPAPAGEGPDEQGLGLRKDAAQAYVWDSQSSCKFGEAGGEGNVRTFGDEGKCGVWASAGSRSCSGLRRH